MALDPFEYLPYGVLVLVFLSVRLEQSSIRNFISVMVGALTLWGMPAVQSPWGRYITYFLYSLPVIMSPLKWLVLRAFDLFIPGVSQYSPVKVQNTEGRNHGIEGRREITTNPTTINALHDPPGAEIDIVAVHGLGSSVETTWTDKSTGALWLRDFLPSDLAEKGIRARIMTFRHNSKWKSQALEKSLDDHARQLLDALHSLRSTDEMQSRPIFFLGHSFGGLLIEQTLVLAARSTATSALDSNKHWAQLADAFAGAIFLGTPHSGSSYSFWGKIYCILHYWEGADPFLLGYLDPDSSEIRRLEDDFLLHFPQLSFDYAESKGNTMLGFELPIVVKKTSSTRPGQRFSVLDTDHFGLNKYGYKDDARYMAVMNKIVEMSSSGAARRQRDIKWRAKWHRDEFHQWVSDLRPEKRHANLGSQRFEGSGFWLLQTGNFRSWMSPLILPPHMLHPCPETKLALESPRLLWVCGSMGSGKSVQAFEIIETMQQLCNESTSKNFGFGYFYFDFNDGSYQKSHNMVRTLVLQLGTRTSQAESLLRRRLYNLYKADRELQPVMFEVLEELIDLYDHTYIVLDALDECSDWGKLYETIQRIMVRTKAKILLVSRDLPYIEANLQQLDVHMSIIKVKGEGVNNDMRAYIQSKWAKSLRPLAKHLDQRQGRRAHVEEELVRKSEGMFRWLELQLMSLGEALCDTVDGKALDDMLDSLPQGLDETYKRILDNVKPTNLEKARKLLRWLCFSVRPMTVREVAQAITIEEPRQTTKGMSFNEKHLPKCYHDILKYCPGLLNTVLVAGQSRERLEDVSENDELRLAHFSVKEYLQSKKASEGEFHIQERATNIYQARACLAFMDWMRKRLLDSEPFVVNYPMATYSAQYWPAHARAAHLAESFDKSYEKIDGRMEKLQKEIERLLGSETRLLTWIRLFDHDHHEPRYNSTATDVLSPLYYAALCGLDYHVEMLVVQQCVDVEAPGGCCERPLRAACRYGFETSVQCLIERGASFPYNRKENEKDNKAEDEKVFADASISGNTSLMEFLLEKEAATQITARPVTHVEAMYQAVLHGHFRMTELLVRSDNVNSDIPREMDRAKSARLLERASADGNARIVDYLLELGAEIDFQGGWYGTAIRAAALEDREAVTRKLLDSGANPNLDGYSPGSAMTAAIDFDRFSIVDILLEHKGSNQFDVNNSEGSSGSSLQLAAFCGHASVVRKLLERGADVNAIGGLHHTALQAACAEGHLEIVDLLLEYGASPNVAGMHSNDETDLWNTMPTFCMHLRLACMSGDERVIRTFLRSWALSFENQVSREDQLAREHDVVEEDQVAEEDHDAARNQLSEEDYSRRSDWLSKVVCLTAPDEAFPSIMMVPWKTVGIRRLGWTIEPDGLTADVMTHVCERLPRVTLQNGLYGSALRAAVIKRRNDIVKRLLDKGACVAMADGGAIGSVIEQARSMKEQDKGHEILSLLEEAATKEQGTLF